MTKESSGGVWLHLGADVALADMYLTQSRDGQHLFVCCRGRIVAIMSAMGGDVDVFEFGDAGRMTAAELMGRL